MKAVIALAAVLVLGCGASQLPPPGADSGNHLRTPPGALESVMAVDAADMVHQLHPNNVPFHVVPPRRDEFGAKLVAELREHGYSVAVGGAPEAGFKQLRYVVDRSDEGLFYVSIKVDGKPMSRIYQCDGDECLPAGAWAVMTDAPEE